MKQKEKELSFEEAMKGLENAVGALSSEDTTLDEAIARYEEGLQYYRRCREILADAHQKIQQFDKETGEIKEF